jgi:hypothetical protein
MRMAQEYRIDENGVYVVEDDTIMECVVCVDCGARHAYDTLHKSGDRYTIALEANSDPEPVATVAIAFRHGDIVGVEADRLVGLIAIDEDRQEIGRFLAPRVDGEAWERAKKLEALIPKGEYKRSFREVENADNN